MKRQVRATLAVSTVTVSALPLLMAMPASAHRLDEYLQATTIALAKDHITAVLCLTPGVAVFPTVIGSIDANKDGRVSSAEQQTYVKRVLRDLMLTLDGKRLPLHLMAYRFASAQEMKEGVGDIEIEFNADVPRMANAIGSNRSNRRLTFENRHQSRISAYLVNCLIPNDPNLQVTAQDRNYQQSRYQLNYVQASGVTNGSSHAWSPSPTETTGTGAGIRMGMWVLASVGGATAIMLLTSTMLPWRRRHSQHSAHSQYSVSTREP